MYKQVIIVRNDLKLGKGKIAAQVAHAAIQAYLKSNKKDPSSVENWLIQGQKKIVLKISSKQEIVSLFEEIKNQFPCALIKDAAHTQLPKPDITCLGIGPIKETEIDRFTKKYSLL